MVAIPPLPWPPAHRAREHRHAFHELALVVEGTCHWRLGRRRLELGQGDILLLPPQRLHREEVPSGRSARLLWIGFDLHDSAAFLAPLLERPWAAGPWAADIEALAGMLYREHQHPELPGSAERVDGLLRALLVTLHRIAAGAGELPSDGRHGAALRAAAHTLQRNLVQPPSVAELARMHGLTPGHFSTLFAAVHQIAPRAFLQRARIREACRRLAARTETVKEIAAACGFAGAPHFCRAFKAATGLTPRAWRNRAASAAEPTTAQELPN
jgi:AraC-type DNA-binding domain-containing proteins